MSSWARSGPLTALAHHAIELDLARDPELFVDVCEVPAHGVRCDPEAACDLAIALSSRERSSHLALAVRERVGCDHPPGVHEPQAVDGMGRDHDTASAVLTV